MREGLLGAVHLHSRCTRHSQPAGGREPACNRSPAHHTSWDFLLTQQPPKLLQLGKCCYCSVAKVCLTLCNPMDCSIPVLHHLSEFASVTCDEHLTFVCLVKYRCALGKFWGKKERLHFSENITWLLLLVNNVAFLSLTVLLGSAPWKQNEGS